MNNSKFSHSQSRGKQHHDTQDSSSKPKFTKHDKYKAYFKKLKTEPNKDPNIKTIDDLVMEFASRATMITDEQALVRLDQAEQEVAVAAEADFSTAATTAPSASSALNSTKKKKFKKPKLDDHLLELVEAKEQQKQAQVQERQARGEVHNPFENFLLEPRLLRNLHTHDFAKATDIQAKAIPEILSGKDILATAATGTGKTLAYLIPAIQYLFDFPSKEPGCKVLIIAPTRDLTLQIYHQAKDLLAGTHYHIDYLLGKLAHDEPTGDLNQAIDVFATNQLVIATPGRIANEFKAHNLDDHHIEMLILDEADRLLEIGAGEDLSVIDQFTHERRQTLMFSATLDKQVVELFSNIAQNQPVQITASHSRSEKNTLTQWYYHCDSVEHKLELLVNLIKEFNLDKTMVFVKKKESVSKVCKYLMNQRMGIRATQIDGDMTKEQRERALGLFVQGKVQVIVTTDLLARGINIDGVKAVINYDIPFDGDTYVHRIGRTGRMGNKGLAISLVESHDYYNLGKAMRYLREEINAKVFPGLEPKTSVNPNAFSQKPGTTIKKRSQTKKELEAREQKQTKAAKKEKLKAIAKMRHRVKKNKGFPKRILAKAAGSSAATINKATSRKVGSNVSED